MLRLIVNCTQPLLPNAGESTLWVAFLDLNGVAYFEECASEELAEKAAEPWLSKAKKTLSE